MGLIAQFNALQTQWLRDFIWDCDLNYIFDIPLARPKGVLTQCCFIVCFALEQIRVCHEHVDMVKAGHILN